MTAGAGLPAPRTSPVTTSIRYWKAARVGDTASAAAVALCCARRPGAAGGGGGGAAAEEAAPRRQRRCQAGATSAA